MAMAQKLKLIKVATVPTSLNIFCRGQLQMLSQHFDVVAVASPSPELEEIRRREGVRCVGLPMERHISLLKDLRSLVLMVRLLRRERPYIVHSMTPKAGLVSMVAAWMCRVPVRMHTYTGLLFPTARGPKKLILMLADKLLCHCATYINPEGFGVANDLAVITRKPMHIIGHGNIRGIDLAYWQRTAAPSIPAAVGQRLEGRFVFLFVGRIVADKGINELIQAFTGLQSLVAPRRKVALLLVGPAEPRLDPIGRRAAREIAHNPAIVSVGKVSDVRPYYAAAHAFVFPSHREGFPNTVLEAGAMGMPQIVSDINGANEIIMHRINGLIIPPRHPDALLRAMRLLLDDSGLRDTLARNARKMVANRYEQRYLWGELLATYNQLAHQT